MKDLPVDSHPILQGEAAPIRQSTSARNSATQTSSPPCQPSSTKNHEVFSRLPRQSWHDQSSRGPATYRYVDCANSNSCLSSLMGIQEQPISLPSAKPSSAVRILSMAPKSLRAGNAMRKMLTVLRSLRAGKPSSAV